MRSSRSGWLGCMLPAVALAAAAGAAEPEKWADKNLGVREGLAAWYDGSTENAARRALKKPRLENLAAVDALHDASGHGRHLAQRSPEARPKFRIDEELRYVRFGGETFLAGDGLNVALAEATFIVVAAPFVNDGNFQAFFAANAQGANDYTSGIVVDQGPFSTPKFAAINVEGAGFGGVKELKRGETPFGQVTRICVTSRVGPGGTTLYVDGRRAGRRDRAEGTIRLDRFTLGARFYTNGGPPVTRGFLNGEIAEVLIYDRVLAEDELAAVDRYLKTKYGDARAVPFPPELAAARPVPKVAEPPSVQMFAPGFEARQLPLELPNINNLRYRPDGKLVAVAYNGQIHLLSDTDGDGLEDRADMFWDRPGIVSPIGMALAPPGYARGQGVFVACKGQVALVVDTNGDDRADELVAVASGWPELAHGVDVLGVAVGPDGSVYYGMGTENYTNGHLVDQQGQAHYRVDAERGAIMRVSPDFKQRTRICSGIRFSVALAFNQAGDLFCTDQEGATWLPNGNPFDELLHIEPGRHYGFPPRHSRHLAGVIDEPSVYDYSPQHQSTCGLCFNEAAEGKPIFGPEWWRASALVCGYSRGKLYRTTLAKTAAGYVADNAVLASLNMLTVDACLAPGGELVVATHSGGPDWGSGPTGKGKLYQIAYRDRQFAQPVRAWNSGPHEVQIAFDRPLEPREHLAQGALIEYGPHVRAGDRFEALWPGYSVVELQRRGSRRLLPVLRTELTADRRTLVLTTGPHDEAVGYAVLLPWEAPQSEARSKVLPQMPVVELSYDLAGVIAHWQPDDGPGWTSWIAHLDLAAAERLMAPTAQGAQLAELRSRRGRLTLRTQLDLWQMLRPAVQPGSTVDDVLPPEEVTVVLESDAEFAVNTAAGELRSRAVDGRQRVAWTVMPQADAWLPLEVTVRTDTARPALAATWHTAEDPRPRAFAVRRFLVPWAKRGQQANDAPSAAPRELAGGDWHKGRELFHSEQAQCGKCHTVRGRGGWIGPDLSNLVHRDYQSVLRDVTNPSFAINPEHLAYQVVLADGRVLTGMVQTRGEAIVVGDIKGQETEIPRGEIEAMRPAMLSIMPEGLPKAIGEAGMRDLLTFLLLAEPSGLEPAPIEQPGAPPPRSRAEVGAVVKNAAPPPADKLKELHVVLVSGPKDHGPGEHDYPAWQKRWTTLLERAPRTKVSQANPWPSAEQWKSADVVVMFSANPAWAPERAKELDAFFARGGGLVLLHYAVNGQRAPDEFARRVGLAWHPENSRYRHGELNLNFQAARPHPITAGLSTLRFVDESYWNLVGDEKLVNVLATQVEEGKPRPLVWTFEPPGGRVFASILGHYSWTFDDPLFRLLVLRGMAWTAREPVDRFNDLLLPGARVAD